ncbi:hypothetical protein Dimus_027414 [Dionaea muscipula]
MALGSLLISYSSFTPWRSKSMSPVSYPGRVMKRGRLGSKPNHRVKAFFFNPIEEPIIKEALKEPVAFMGGVFAGLLRLDMNDDPLKEWVKKTVEAAGITEEEIVGGGSNAEEDAPQQIEIE